MTRALKTTAWLLMMLLASTITLVSLRYFFLAPERAAGPLFGSKFAQHHVILLAHIAGGTLALLLGPWQFLPALRERLIGLHRWIGRLYLLAILSGSIGGFCLATIALGGLPAQIGFASLALSWLGTGTLAYTSVRRGDIRAHRYWMIRNYALTFAAVTLRLWLPLFGALGCEFVRSYTIIAWLCWIPNLVLAELIISRSRERLRPPGRVNAVMARDYAS